MKTVNIDHAAPHLAQLIQDALDGEEVILARGDVPVVRLAPVAPARPGRTSGWARGQVRIADDFDAPLGDFGG